MSFFCNGPVALVAQHDEHNGQGWRVIQFQEVTKTFGSRTAVNKVSFNIEKPQMVGIIGRSGAGKSTLLRMINRLTPASDASCHLSG